MDSKSRDVKQCTTKLKANKTAELSSSTKKADVQSSTERLINHSWRVPPQSSERDQKVRDDLYASEKADSTAFKSSLLLI